MSHAVLLVGVGYVVGGVLDILRSVGHGHTQSGKPNHVLVVIAVAAGYDLILTETQNLKETL